MARKPRINSTHMRQLGIPTDTHVALILEHAAAAWEKSVADLIGEESSDELYEARGVASYLLHHDAGLDSYQVGDKIQRQWTTALRLKRETETRHATEPVFTKKILSIREKIADEWAKTKAGT